MILTYFKAEEIGKIPYSKDNEFIFLQTEIELKDVYKLNKDYWILNGTFKKLPENFKSKRNKIYLKEYFAETFDFIILDFDDVKTKSNMMNIIEILKNENLHFSLWESTSHNGKDNFNLKGIVEIKGNNNETSLRKAIQYIDNLLKNYCKASKNAGICSLQA